MFKVKYINMIYLKKITEIFFRGSSRLFVHCVMSYDVALCFDLKSELYKSGVRLYFDKFQQIFFSKSRIKIYNINIEREKKHPTATTSSCKQLQPLKPI